MKNRDELKRNFTYHAPTESQVADMKEIREHALWLGTMILDKAPECAERTLAIRALEQTVMWANAAIVRPPITKEEQP